MNKIRYQGRVLRLLRIQVSILLQTKKRNLPRKLAKRRRERRLRALRLSVTRSGRCAAEASILRN